MPSGGARARSGPAPETDSAGYRWLDPDARKGVDAPEWPADIEEPTVGELAMWQAEWQRPQAVLWAEERQEISVAMYVRMFKDALRPGGPVTARDKVRILMDALFITSDGLARARLRIGRSPQGSKGVSADAVSRAADRGWSVVKGGG